MPIRESLPVAKGVSRRPNSWASMSEFFHSAGVQAVLWSAVLAALLAVGGFLIVKLRTMRREEPPAASDMLTEFRDLHARGKLSDEEFKSIKNRLAQRLQEEWTRNGEKG